MASTVPRRSTRAERAEGSGSGSFSSSRTSSFRSVIHDSYRQHEEERGDEGKLQPEREGEGEGRGSEPNLRKDDVVKAHSTARVARRCEERALRVS